MSETQRVVRVFPDAEAVSQAAAVEFVRVAGESVAARGRFTVTLSGGSTPKRLFELLAEAPFRDQVAWAKVEVFWGDERCLSPDHPDSNYRMAREAMLERLPGLPPAQVHRMEGERPDPEAAARDYEATLSRVLGVPTPGTPPALDLVLLGMGPDGHTASLFPGNRVLGEKGRWVAAVHDSPKPPPDRLTLTTAILNRAREVLFLVAGKDKEQTLAEVLEGPPDTNRLPSQLIHPEGRLVWFVDRAASTRLTQTATDAGA